MIAFGSPCPYRLAWHRHYGTIFIITSLSVLRSTMHFVSSRYRTPIGDGGERCVLEKWLMTLPMGVFYPFLSDGPQFIL